VHGESRGGIALPAPVTELSNYELRERRSRELEEARARGGLGTSQPPDAKKPLLFPKFCTVKETPSRNRHVAVEALEQNRC
jgi:hypothetical protein